MKIIKVVFLDSKGKLPKNYKSYNYLIEDSRLKAIDVGGRDTNKWVKYEITNNNGFNYRGSNVIFIAYKDIDKDEEIVGYNEIVKVTPKGVTDFLGDEGFKNIIREERELFRKGWKLASINLNDYAAITSCVTATNTTTASNYVWGTSTTPISTNTIATTYIPYSNYDDIQAIKCRLDELEKKNKKEKSKMFESLTKNLKCGRAQDVRMSIYGPAFKGEDGNWYAIGTDNILTDVTDLLFDMDSYCYMMPVAKNQIHEGDFILHNSRWVRVDRIGENGVEGALDIFKKEFIVPAITKSPFGFEFYTKLVPLLDFSKFQADTNTPFGALPMILMMNNKNDKDMLPMLMMMGAQSGFNFDMSNPMMMYFLMKDGGNDSLLPFLMMNQMNKASD